MMIEKIKGFLERIIVSRKFRQKGGKLERPLFVRGYKSISVGQNVRVKKNARIECYYRFGGKKYFPNLVIGNNVIVGYGVTFLVTDTISIGDETMIAHNVTISTENHGIDPESRSSYSKQQLDSKPVKIGANCWIGANVCVLEGVELGDNCVVAANAVVTKSFPSNVIVAGVPAKVIKKYDCDLHEWIHC